MCKKVQNGKIFTAAFFIVYLQAAYKQGRFGSGLLRGWPTSSIFVCMINFALLTYYNSCFLTYCMDFNVRTISICTFFHMDILLFRLFTISIAMAKLLNFWHVWTCLEHVLTCFDMFRHNPITRLFCHSIYLSLLHKKHLKSNIHVILSSHIM